MTLGGLEYRLLELLADGERCGADLARAIAAGPVTRTTFATRVYATLAACGEAGVLTRRCVPAEAQPDQRYRVFYALTPAGRALWTRARDGGGVPFEPRTYGLPLA